MIFDWKPQSQPYAVLAALALLAISACSPSDQTAESQRTSETAPPSPSYAGATRAREAFAELPPVPPGHETAVFAGGCFWCVESDFDRIPGVVATTSGYTGGDVARPSYKQVSYTETGHYEAVHVIYDPAQVRYEDLLTAFWHSVDPTDDGGQFCDRGSSYKSAIFVDGSEQRNAAQESKAAIIASGVLAEPVVTPILEAKTFYPAETYHQDFYLKKPLRYNYYRTGCRRDRTVERVWGSLAFKGLPGY